MTWSDPPFAIAASVLMALFLAWFAGMAKFRAVIRSHHPEVAQQLGGPPLIGASSSQTLALLRFLFGKEAAGIEDITGVVWALRVVLVAFTIVFATVVTLMFT